MIAYMEGKILKVTQDAILLLAGNIGYEILLPAFVMEKIAAQNIEPSESQICLYIYYYQTERQPKPILIGFNAEDEKEFFQSFISVDAIGPLKAVKAMERPISQIAAAIEQQNVDFLAGLKGIGKRTAQKIVATLHGKVSRFIAKSNTDLESYSSEPTKSSAYPSSYALDGLPDLNSSLSMQKIAQQVVDVLVEQLGYTGAIAKKMVSMAIDKKPSISTPEELFDAVLKGRH
ncbi:MAG: Holliday junction DNA helicase RuvA [Desulfamplus sp.]|nr:Holliday junction DNA helicase RuvA [Desulfamplus sp.]MBF0240910.1 Holliday junction DNA helicase RuvA [Desulfamplus sp.]